MLDPHTLETEEKTPETAEVADQRQFWKRGDEADARFKPEFWKRDDEAAAKIKPEFWKRDTEDIKVKPASWKLGDRITETQKYLLLMITETLERSSSLCGNSVGKLHRLSSSWLLAQE